MSRIPAAKKGLELIQEIRRATIPHGRVGVWWLGQATFCFKFGEMIVYTDPFYRTEDQAPPTLSETPLKPDEFVDADLIFCTHEHLDHLDPETLPGAMRASPNVKLVLPAAIVENAATLGIPRERMIAMRGDDTHTYDSMTIHAIPAAHMTLDYDPRNGFHYLGYVLQANGVSIYLLGDMQPYPGWYQRVADFQPFDGVFLPISAVDNLHYTQAVYFCALHRPKLAVPMHYNMFAGYNEDPNKFIEALGRNCPEQKARIMNLGEGWLI